MSNLRVFSYNFQSLVQFQNEDDPLSLLFSIKKEKICINLTNSGKVNNLPPNSSLSFFVGDSQAIKMCELFTLSIYYNFNILSDIIYKSILITLIYKICMAFSKII